MKVSPVTWEKSRYHSYDVSASYTPCCNAAQSNLVDQKIKALIQMVYDTYIRVIQRRIDDHCCQRNPPPASGLPCRQIHLSFLKLLYGGHSRETYRQHRENNPTNSAEVEEGQALVSASPMLLQPQITCLVPHPAKRKQDDKASDNPPPKKRPKHKKRLNSEIASSLIKKIQSGMKMMEDRREEQSDHSEIQAIMACCQQNNDDNRIDTLLEKLDAAFKKTSKATKNEHKNKKKQDKRNQRASGAYIINSIINILLPSEGIKALAVILACAEHCHTLNEASIKGEQHQKEICEKVAEGLKENLLTPPGHCTIPNVATWVSVITKCSYGRACQDLGFSHLGVLQLNPEWTKEGVLDEGLPYKFLAERWHAFEIEQSRSRRTYQEYDPDKWARPALPEQFVLTANNEWCHSEEESSSVTPLSNPRTQRRRQVTQLSSSPQGWIHNDAVAAQQTVNVVLEAAHQTEFTGVGIQDSSEDWTKFVDFSIGTLGDVMVPAHSVGSLESG
ncbi:hypothetical protein F5B19DRAFT_498547 [Rostrohypoxylon terebratum]|nr:hypothetical protein F5B19DRAFT_498547 [Rostrohypoxylon terebratum]